MVKTHDRGVTRGEEDDIIPTDIPFVCVICREEYNNPIVTQCRHYFCEVRFGKIHERTRLCGLRS